ncbi:hypothetical protein ALPO108162_13445 [Alicyclobacillus pomorum]|jgi:hypothetical protein
MDGDAHMARTREWGFVALEAQSGKTRFFHVNKGETHGGLP